VYLTLDEIFTEKFPMRRGVYFMEAKPDLPALFKKRTEIKYKNKFSFN
jgi:hypothetical protein